MKFGLNSYQIYGDIFNSFKEAENSFKILKFEYKIKPIKFIFEEKISKHLLYFLSKDTLEYLFENDDHEKILVYNDRDALPSGYKALGYDVVLFRIN